MYIAAPTRAGMQKAPSPSIWTTPAANVPSALKTIGTTPQIVKHALTTSRKPVSDLQNLRLLKGSS